MPDTIGRLKAEYKMPGLAWRYTRFLQVSRAVAGNPGSIAEIAAIKCRAQRHRFRPAIRPSGGADILCFKRSKVALSRLQPARVVLGALIETRNEIPACSPSIRTG